MAKNKMNKQKRTILIVVVVVLAAFILYLKLTDNDLIKFSPLIRIKTNLVNTITDQTPTTNPVTVEECSDWEKIQCQNQVDCSSPIPGEAGNCRGTKDEMKCKLISSNPRKSE